MRKLDPSVKRNWSMAELQSFTPAEKRYAVLSDRYPGLRLLIRPSGSKTWVVEYRAPERKTLTIGPLEKWTHKAAADFAKEAFGKSKDPHQDKIDARQRARQERLQKGSIADLISDEGDYWVLRMAGNPRSKEIRQRIHNAFSEIVNLPVKDITPIMLERGQAKRRNAGISPGSIQRERSMLSPILNFAVDQGMIPENPLKKVPGVKVDNNRPPRYLDKEMEWPRLSKALNDPRTSRHIADLVKVALGTGMRRGELFKLTWDNVNLEGRQLTVIGTSAKTGTTRHIPLNDSVLAVFKARAKEFGEKTPTGLVFPGEDGQLTTIKTGFAGLLRRARITNFRFHDCRHTFASWLVQSGVPLNTVRDLLGHKSLTMTLRYSHLAPENKSSAVQLIDLG